MIAEQTTEEKLRIALAKLEDALGELEDARYDAYAAQADYEEEERENKRLRAEIALLKGDPPQTCDRCLTECRDHIERLGERLCIVCIDAERAAAQDRAQRRGFGLNLNPP